MADIVFVPSNVLPLSRRRSCPVQRFVRPFIPGLATMLALLPHCPLSSQKSAYRLPSTPHSISRPNTPNTAARITCPVETPSTRIIPRYIPQATKAPTTRIEKNHRGGGLILRSAISYLPFSMLIVGLTIDYMVSA